MATLIKNVDKTNVKFTDKFTYTINAAFSGIEGNINNAVITDFIPNTIDYTLPPVKDPIRSITVENQDQGDLISFNFGEITDTGISVAINLSCQFKLGTDSQTTFTNEANMYINDDPTPVQTSTSEEVILDVNEDFIIEKEIAVPSNRVSSAGSRVIYTIFLRNNLTSQGGNGDIGAKVKNVVITDILPAGILLDPLYPVYGSDRSTGGYKDTRYDGRVGEVEGNEITFTLPDYYGNVYRIIMICKVSEDVEIGDEITNTSTLSIDDTPRGSNTSTISIGQPTYGASINKYAPKYSQVGSDISYDLIVRNTENQRLLDVIVEDRIPDEIKITKLNTGSFKIDVINEPIPVDYDIEYELNNSETYTVLGTYNMAVAEYVDLPEVGELDKITKIRWRLPSLSVGAVQARNITLDGTIIRTNEEDEIVNVGEIIWTDDNGVEASTQSTKTTVITEKSELNIEKEIVNEDDIVIPGTILKYKVSVDGNSSNINNPVIADVLSELVEYVGNERYRYYSYFDDTIYDSDTTPNFFDVVPVVKEIITDYKGENKTLIRYTIDNFTLIQRGWLTVEYEAKVKPGSIGTITNSAIIGNIGDNGLVAPGQTPYVDSDDVDNDGINEETIVISDAVNTEIVYDAGLSSNKKVKGALDQDYTEEPEVGKTYEGGAVDYKLQVKNTGNLDFEYIEIVDILPHIGDTGVILNKQNRKSEFDVYNKGEVVASIMEDGIIVDNVDLKIEYSKSYDPVRFAQSNFGDDTIGEVDDWSEVLPSPALDAKSIKLIAENILIKPNQYIQIDMRCIAAIGVDVDLVAWNSFAVKARYIDENGVSKKLIPAEPEKVGVEVLEQDKAEIGGKAWIDKNKNGNIDKNEVGLNGITVYLLSEDKQIIKTSITSNDKDSNPGYYSFKNIDIGNYYIQFEQPQGLYFTKYNSETDNKADTTTGRTDLITVQELTDEILDIHVGYIEEVNFILRLLEILENDLFTIDCEVENIIETINGVVKSLINLTNDIVAYIERELISQENTDMGYLAQLSRLVTYLRNILSKLRYINIPLDYCNTDILVHLMILLSDYILTMVTTLEIHDGINVYYNKCECMGSVFYELMVGRFINSLMPLYCIAPMFNDILMIIHSQTTIKPYVAAYVKKPDMRPQMRPVSMGMSCPPSLNCNNTCRPNPSCNNPCK